jgi:hypothetical protein
VKKIVHTIHLFFDIFRKTNKKIGVICLVFAFVSGCVTVEKKSEEESILEPFIEIKEKEIPYIPVSEYPAEQLKIVENFNKEDERNQLGGRNFFKPRKSVTVFTAYERAGAFRASGKYLKISYALKNYEKASLRIELNRLDVSQASLLFFLLKSDTPEVRENISLTLTDTQKRAATLFVKKYYSEIPEGKGWGEVNIPKRAFGLVDFNMLESLEIVIAEDQGTEIKGSIALDTILFAGEGNVYFESLKDNLAGFPHELLVIEREAELKKMEDAPLIGEIAKDTWQYFEKTVDKNTHLPLDQIKVDKKQWIGDYTSPTNIGLYLTALSAAQKMRLISEEEARERAKNTLQTVKTLPTWNGFLFNYYNTTTLKPTSSFVSSVDCGWFAAGLIVARQTWGGEVALFATRMLKKMDFGIFYDQEIGQMRIGYDGEKKELTKYHYGLLATEARIASLIAIGKGDVEKEHWFRMYRTLPVEWEWQNQAPLGEEKEYFDQKIFAGYYEYKDKKVVPSWGGSLFEFLMPTLIVDEKGLAPKGLGLNNRIATEIHIDYALNEKQCGVWGLSPCSVPGNKFGGYTEFGVPILGAKGYKDIPIITPHVSFLALDVLPEEAIKNMRHLLTQFDMYGEYGFYDAIETRPNVVSYRYLALDQAMIFISCVNYLRNDAIKKVFHQDKIAQAVEELLSIEDFFN